MLAALLAVTISTQPGPKPTSNKPIVLRPGLVITKSGRTAPGIVRIPNPNVDLKAAAIEIRGDNLTVDFKGTILEGSPQSADPDARTGTGLLIRGNNVTIKNLTVRGYKVGIAAVNSDRLKILSSDGSYNWKQRLLSTEEREDYADWMSYHRNEKDEWLRYGAGIYLRNCDGFEVKDTRVTGGQNGLLITECNQGLIWNNNFSFLSSLGIGMYASSDNRIMHNKVDWCVRGYSHGRWNRGQDSSGILIYEQSHRNVFAYNSVTHGGDGFFLWAGQTTMDTGKGGCNDNLLYGNDWSHAPTNGIEATFSRNRFVNNKILECWHGIWGGYSYETEIIGNVFGHNGEGIAIEHGQDNTIQWNVFDNDHVGIYIWQNASQDPNWGYPKNRDTRSRDWTIRANRFQHASHAAIEVRDTLNFSVTENRIQRNAVAMNWSGAMEGLKVQDNLISSSDTKIGAFTQGNTFRAGAEDSMGPNPTTMNRNGLVVDEGIPTGEYLQRFSVAWNPWPNKPVLAPSIAATLPAHEKVKAEQAIRAAAPAPLTGGIDPFLKPDTLRGRRYILIDEWGPYDFRSPKLWPRGDVKPQAQGPEKLTEFEVLGPPGAWTLKSISGGRIVSGDKGKVPGTLVVAIPTAKANQLKIDLEYRGAKTTDVRGQVTAAGRPVRFGYSRSTIPIAWNISFFRWTEKARPDDVHSPPLESALAAIFQQSPITKIQTDRLDLAGRVAGVPATLWATRAEGDFDVEPGTYVIDLTTDDGARVWLDGKPLIEDAWKYQGPTLYSREVKLSGKHRLKVEHFQISGHAALSLKIRKKQ